MMDDANELQIAVLLDWQNVYNGAREAFDLHALGHIAGNVDPWQLAGWLARASDATRQPRVLSRVRVYRGMPDQARDERTYRAFRAQTAAWERAGGGRLQVCSKLLRYPPQSARGERPTEKGIDVWLAVDLVGHALRRDVDRVVVFSTDTDLVPALEMAVAERGAEFVEVAAWVGSGSSAAMLRVPGHRIVQRALKLEHYERLHDPSNYNLPKGHRGISDRAWDAQIAQEGRVPRRK